VGVGRRKSGHAFYMAGVRRLSRTKREQFVPATLHSIDD
jgi:hypothetical protein